MKSPALRHWVVIPAAGRGTRMGASRPKQYLELAGTPVLAHTLRCFVGHPAVAGIVVALAPDDSDWATLDASLRAAVDVADGGAERADSVRNGLAALAGRATDHDWVLVHDAARPCLRQDDVTRLVDIVLTQGEGAILALPVVDTVKLADAHVRTVTMVDANIMNVGVTRGSVGSRQDIKKGHFRCNLVTAGRTDLAEHVYRHLCRLAYPLGLVIRWILRQHVDAYHRTGNHLR